MHVSRHTSWRPSTRWRDTSYQSAAEEGEREGVETGLNGVARGRVGSTTGRGQRER